MKRHVVPVLVVGLVIVTGCGKKQETQQGEITPESTSQVPSPARDHGSGEAVTPANTAAGIWKQIDDERTALHNVIAAGSLGEVHEHAFAIRDLVAALPAVTTDPAAKNRIEAAKETVTAEAADLDKAGDAGDLTATQAALGRLEATLASLRG